MVHFSFQTVPIMEVVQEGTHEFVPSIQKPHGLFTRIFFIIIHV
jgi:hypothetical protein